MQYAGITILLALSVYQMIVNEKLPATSDAVPLLGKQLYLGQGRRKQIESGGPISGAENFLAPHFSFGPLYFNSMKLKWGHKRKVEAPKTAHLQISNKALYLWQCFLLLPF